MGDIINIATAQETKKEEGAETEKNDADSRNGIRLLILTVLLFAPGLFICDSMDVQIKPFWWAWGFGMMFAGIVTLCLGAYILYRSSPPDDDENSEE